MEQKEMVENNYSELLKKELEKLVNEGQKRHCDLTLEDKLINKNKGIKSHLNENEKNLYIYFIISNSLFFLKGNEFVKDNYFSLFDNTIYKAFYELLLKPSETQFNILQREFEKLEHGAGAIYLLCLKIYKSFKMSNFDLFFSIVIKDNFHRIERLLHKNASNYEKFIEKLKAFKDSSKIKESEAFNFFIEAMTESQIQSNTNINIALNKGNKGKDNNKIHDKKNLKSDAEISIKKDGDDKNENKISIEEEKVDNNNNIPKEINNSQINTFKENIPVSKLLEYLNKQKKIYEKICPTPVLDFLIQNNGELKLDYIGYNKNPDSFIDHIYENLNKLIDKLNLGEFADETQGYFCFFDEETNKYVEALYSKIDLDLLFHKITADENFPKDNFFEPDKTKAKNAFKSRALSFEYYINKMVIIDKFKMKERSRVFYPFKSLQEILGKEEKDKKALNLVEVDGVILEQKRYDFTLERNAFIVDDLYKLDEFETSNRQIVTEPYVEKTIDIKKNELCIIEIKNQFPPSTNAIEKAEQKEKQPSTFYQVLKSLIRKAKIFKQLYDFKNEKIDHIRLMLFYDTIQKENYYEDLKKAFAESFQEKDKSKYLYEFQCIYIKSSYLAASHFNMNDKCTKLEKCFNELKVNSSKEILSLKKEIVNIQKTNFKENSKLKHDIINSVSETMKLKEEFLAYKKNISEEVFRLQGIINDSSKTINNLQVQLFNSENEKKKEILDLSEINNNLLSEIISLKENKLIQEKKDNFPMTVMKDFHEKDENLSIKEEEKTKENIEKMHQETRKLNEEFARNNWTKKIIDDILSLNLGKDAEKKILEFLNKQ